MTFDGASRRYVRGWRNSWRGRTRRSDGKTEQHLNLCDRCDLLFETPRFRQNDYRQNDFSANLCALSGSSTRYSAHHVSRVAFGSHPMPPPDC
jgi:hypothetical protein